MIKMRFPGGLDKALTLSYDDDTRHNIRFVEILNRYGVKGTFNLNFGLFSDPPTEATLSLDEAKALFAGGPHEVAIHGYKHLSLGAVPDPEAVREVVLDRDAAEKAFGSIVRGMAYANGSFGENTGDVLNLCGVAYSRTVRSTHSFEIPGNWFYLDPTCHHMDARLFELTDDFLNTPTTWGAKLFYLWGHAYEFNTHNNWELIEEFCQKAGGREDVWYATNIEIYDYVKAYGQLVFSMDGTTVYNPTNTEIFAAKCHPYGRRMPSGFSVKPGQTLDLTAVPEPKRS